MTKLKLIFATSALLIAGTAFAQSAAKPEKPDVAAHKAAMRDARIEKKFAMLDANKDGVITLDEMKAGAHKAHLHKGKHRRGFGGKRHGQQVK